jgi:hypothetical protein
VLLGSLFFCFNSNLGAAELNQWIYCHYKGHSLLKFLIGCAPNGRILFLLGPIPGSVSDDTALLEYLSNDGDEGAAIKVWIQNLQRGAGFVVDSGAQTELYFTRSHSQGFPKLGAQEQVGNAFNVSDVKIYCPVRGRQGERWGNAQLLRATAVTRFRGVIERVNRRLKIFKYLQQTLSNSSMSWARPAWRVAAILCNRWFVPLAREPGSDTD